MRQNKTKLNHQRDHTNNLTKGIKPKDMLRKLENRALLRIMIALQQHSNT